MKTIRILNKDIRGANRMCWNNCPLARALKRKFPGAEIVVGTEGITFDGHYVDHTPDTRAFVAAWLLGQVKVATLAIDL